MTSSKILHAGNSIGATLSPATNCIDPICHAPVGSIVTLRLTQSFHPHDDAKILVSSPALMEDIALPEYAEIDDVPAIHWMFDDLQRALNSTATYNLFPGAIRYLEDEHDLRIYIIGNSVVDAGKSLAIQIDGNILIMLNNDDLRDGCSTGERSRDRREVIRFLIAHELGHIASRHLEEFKILKRMRKGSPFAPNFEFAEYLEIFEHEANDFAGNMIYANGEILVRQVLRKEEFETKLLHDENPVSLGVLRSAEYRQKMLSGLRRYNYIFRPDRLICQALCRVENECDTEGLYTHILASRLQEKHDGLLLKKKAVTGIERDEQEETTFTSLKCLSCPHAINFGCCPE